MQTRVVAYPYRTLAPGSKEIRLLDLHPGCYDDEISCSLRTVSLDADPDYTTLSYVWGNPNTRATLIVNGRSVSVPASSAAVLRRVRLHDKPRTLWIDAICINQEDLDERAKQVVLMRNIYSAGKLNLIYLGDSATAEEEVVETYKIHDEAKQVTDDFLQFESTVTGSGEDFIWANADLPRGVRWKTIGELFTNPWFRRVWVMQEAALSSENLCLYGKHDFPLIDILRAFVWMYHRSSYARAAGLTEGMCGLLWELVDQDCGRYRRSSSSSRFARGPDMRFALSLGRQLLSSEPRDKIFGLLGLMQHIPDQLLPDYRKPVEHVFREATRHALHEENGWRILNEIKHHSQDEVQDPDWPSWLPRYNRPVARDVDADNFYRWKSTDSQSLHICDTAHKSDMSLLSLRGLLVDEVVAVTPKLTQECILNINQFAPWYQEVKKMLSSAADQTASILLAGVNVIDFTPGIGRLDELALLAFECFILMRNALPPGDDYVNLPEEALDGNEELCTQKAAALFYKQFGRTCKNRLVFRTSKGLLGVGPGVARPGDVVVMLYGCPYPCVLRRHGPHYKILGLCYVHGIMDGEVMMKHEAEKKPSEMFALC